MQEFRGHTCADVVKDWSVSFELWCDLFVTMTGKTTQLADQQLADLRFVQWVFV